MYGKYNSYNSGVASLSPKVAAAAQWLENNKGIPRNQVVNFLISQGNPELAGLIATKFQTEDAAKAEQALAQQPPAAPPTVADKYRMIEQQQSQQAMAAQMAQMQQARMAQAAPGLAGMPNPAMDRASFAGGGIVAFADGGDVQHFQVGGGAGGVPDFYVNPAGEVTTDPNAELWKKLALEKQAQEEIAQRAARLRAAESAARNAGNTAAAEAAAAEAAAAEATLGAGAEAGAGASSGIASFLSKKFPTFVKYGSKLGAVTKRSPLISVPVSLYEESQTDPESLQANSRLAQLGIIKPDANADWKTWLSGLLGVAESNIPYAGLFYQTPLEKARAATDKKVAGIESDIMRTTASPEETTLAQQYNQIVQQYGPNSEQARQFAENYRRRTGATQAPAAQAGATGSGTQGGTTRPAAGASGRTTTPASGAPESEDITKGSVFDQARKLGLLEANRPTLEQAEKEADEYAKKTKTGPYSQALLDQQQFIEKQIMEQGKSRQEAQKNFWIMAGASLLGNSSPHFSVALGEALSQNYGNLIKDMKEIDKESRELKLLGIKLQREQEVALETGHKDALARTDRLQNAYDTKQYSLLTAQNSITQEVLNRASRERIAALDRAGRRDISDDLRDRMNAIVAEKDPNKKKALQDEFTEALGLAGRAVSATSSSVISQREKALATLRSSIQYRMAKPDEQAAMERRVIAESSAGEEPISQLPPTSVSNPYSAMSTEELKQRLGL